VKRHLDITLAALLALALAGSPLACGSSSSEESSPPGSSPDVSADAEAPRPLAAQITIEEISLNQGVKVSLVKAGAIIAGDALNAPIIAGRPGMLRVFVKATGRERPVVDAELTVRRPGKPDLVLRDDNKSVVSKAADGDLGTTMNFSLAAEDIVPETSVTLRVGPRLAPSTLPPAPVAPGAVPAEELRFPATSDGATLLLPARTASETLRVKFVPVTMDDEGTARAPDLADVSYYRDVLYKMYPVANVELTVRDPFVWTQAVEPDGEGWDELLTGIMQLRRADQSPQNVYYVGVFTPKKSVDEFCSRGSCVLGIAPQADERQVNLRVALVLGYQSRGSGGTLAQELAHAMGRAHAPCGRPDNIDADYPYPGGRIGAWGYDLLEKKWLDPEDRSRDFMSYCNPVWVSDYTFRGIFERMEIVTKQAAVLGQDQAKAMQSFRIDRRGEVHEGPLVDVLPAPAASKAAQPSRSASSIRYETAEGRVLGTAEATVQPIAGTGGKLVIGPVAPAGAARARIAGLGVTALRASSPRR